MAEEKKQPIVIKKCFNPTSEDLLFQWNSANYVVKAGESEEFVDCIAEHAAKKLADKNILTNDPAEHQVLKQAYLENSEPEVIAARLKIDLAKIRKEAMTKEKEKARVVNLESIVRAQADRLAALEGKLEKVAETKEEQGNEENEKKGDKKEEAEEDEKEALSWSELRVKAREFGMEEVNKKSKEEIEEFLKDK